MNAPQNTDQPTDCSTHLLTPNSKDQPNLFSKRVITRSTLSSKPHPNSSRLDQNQALLTNFPNSPNTPCDMSKLLPSPSPTSTQHLSPQALQTTVDRLFTPFLRPPRIHSKPSPPSLAASRLPPPAAEIDERPRYRVRRFRLWRDNAPALRMVVLDPRRRRMFSKRNPL